LIWGCDLTVAREDALIAWGHTAMGKVVDSAGEVRGFPWAMTPSYGMASLLYMPPSKAKEFMMVSKVYTARELADMNALNYAVPAGELDAVTDSLVAQLLERPDSVLTRIKQLCNKRLESIYHDAEQLSRAFAALDMYEQAANGSMG
jgi:enoyl-CoA hydratase/carnithine racemase